MFLFPNKSIELKQLEIIEKRSHFSLNQMKTIKRLRSGYAGERVLFNLLEKKLSLNPIKIFNLHLKINGSECQIDCLLLYQDECILIEVKNYYGNFYVKEQKWFTVSNDEIRNPLSQLHRTELLLKQFFKEERISIGIRSFIVFTHEEFYLYHAPLDYTVVFPTQHKQFLSMLNSLPCHLSEKHRRIEKMLKSRHVKQSAYQNKVEIDYHKLSKNLFCGQCGEVLEVMNYVKVYCNHCRTLRHVNTVVVEGVRELNIINPDEKITVSKVFEWFGGKISEKRIRKVLSLYCKKVGRTKNTYYILDKNI